MSFVNELRRLGWDIQQANSQYVTAVKNGYLIKGRNGPMNETSFYLPTPDKDGVVRVQQELRFKGVWFLPNFKVNILFWYDTFAKKVGLKLLSVGF